MNPKTIIKVIIEADSVEEEEEEEEEAITGSGLRREKATRWSEPWIHGGFMELQTSRVPICGPKRALNIFVRQQIPGFRLRWAKSNDQILK